LGITIGLHAGGPGSISGGAEFFSALGLEFGVHSASWGQLGNYFNQVATSGDIIHKCKKIIEMEIDCKEDT
jgi:hypothetical protein